MTAMTSDSKYSRATDFYSAGFSLTLASHF